MNTCNDAVAVAVTQCERAFKVTHSSIQHNTVMDMCPTKEIPFTTAPSSIPHSTVQGINKETPFTTAPSSIPHSTVQGTNKETTLTTAPSSILHSMVQGINKETPCSITTQYGTWYK